MKLVNVASHHCDEIPYTTPELIAGYAQGDSFVIKDYIQKHRKDFQQLTVFPRSMYCEQLDQNQLNEGQTTLLLSRIKDYDSVRQLRDELIRQFDAINEELNLRKSQRELYYIARQERTDLLRGLGVMPIHHGAYAELGYLSAFGESTDTVRSKYGVPARAQTVDYMTAEDIATLTQAQYDISAYLRKEYSYEQIRALVTPQPLDSNEESTPEDVPGADMGVMFWKFVAENIRPHL